MTDLNDLFKVLAEGKKDYETNNPMGQKLKQVKESAKTDLTDIFSQLTSIKTNLEKELVILEAKHEEQVINEISTLVAEETLTEEIPQIIQPEDIPSPEERAASVQQDALKYLSGKSFQQPNPDIVSQDIDDVRAKIKFLEQAIGRIAATGPGGGEVNLRWLDDVDRSTIQDGYFLKYNATKQKFEFVEIKAETALQDTGEPMGHQNKLESQISFNPVNRTFTITPTSVSYVIYTRGTRRVINDTRTIALPNTTGLYYIYFDPAGVLQYRTSFFDWPNDCMTAYVYWNAENQTAPFVADERHGITLDWQTHEYLHRTRGSVYANGFACSGYTLMADGSLDSHMQINLNGGTFFDEDLQVDIVHTNMPAANTWEQDLQGPAKIPMFYKINGSWVTDSPTDFPLKQGSTLAQYNYLNSGVWTTIDIDNNKYGITFIVATNNINYPIIGIIGQSSHANEADAIAIDLNELDLTGLPIVELRQLYKLVYDTKTAYTNIPHSRLTKVIDLRNVSQIQLNNV